MELLIAILFLAIAILTGCLVWTWSELGRQRETIKTLGEKLDGAHARITSLETKRNIRGTLTMYQANKSVSLPARFETVA